MLRRLLVLVMMVYLFSLSSLFWPAHAQAQRAVTPAASIGCLENCGEWVR